MPMYKVALSSIGGTTLPPMVVEAKSPDQAKELAVQIANAQAKAKGQSIVFRATNVNWI